MYLFVREETERNDRSNLKASLESESDKYRREEKGKQTKFRDLMDFEQKQK